MAHSDRQFKFENLFLNPNWLLFKEIYDEDDDEEEEDDETEKLAFDSPHPWLDVHKGFSWSRYLECTNSRSAPAKLFSEAFPNASNNFKVGQKLEAIGKAKFWFKILPLDGAIS